MTLTRSITRNPLFGLKSPMAIGHAHMPFALVKLPNEPIVIVMGDVPIEDHLGPLHSIFAQVDRVASEVGCRLYFVADARNLTNLSYSDILIWLDELRAAPPGSPRDPRVEFWVVGTHDLLPILVKKMRQQFGIEPPLVTTLEEALDGIRAEIRAVGG